MKKHLLRSLRSHSSSIQGIGGAIKIGLDVGMNNVMDSTTSTSIVGAGALAGRSSPS